jgi:2-oxoglutarate ferredoxin oxidoreductase subunit beta
MTQLESELKLKRDGYEVVYERPRTLVDVPNRYCPGCGHSVVHRVLMEVVEELDIQSDIVGVASVGCTVFAYDYLDIDMQGAAHGRATAVATGIKRMLPDKYVFTYQGDGDLAAIGTAETIHTANRGENILILFINNGIYGMTGGQMAPTTILGAATSTSPDGRNLELHGHPLKITELIAQLPGVAYVTRQSVHKPANVRKFKKSLVKSLQLQHEKAGLCLIEVVSNCPSNWKMTPIESNRWMEENIIPEYPLGDLKVPSGKEL